MQGKHSTVLAVDNTVFKVIHTRIKKFNDIKTWSTNTSHMD